MAKQRHLTGLSQRQKEFVKLIESVDYHTGNYDRFRDFCELAAMSMVMAVDPTKAVVERLKRLHSKYDRTKLAIFDQALDVLIAAMEDGYHDFLGPVYMALEISNDHSGQFFTPWSVCKMTARMSLPTDLEGFIADNGGFITVNDPCIGAGAMLLAVVDEFRERDIDYSNKLYLVAQDIDLLCCYMAYIQLSLSGVAAEIIWGDSLRPAVNESWHTPVYHVNGWVYKTALRQFQNLRAALRPDTVTPEPVIKIAKESTGQMVFDFGVKEAV